MIEEIKKRIEDTKEKMKDAYNSYERDIELQKRLQELERLLAIMNNY